MKKREKRFKENAAAARSSAAAAAAHEQAALHDARRSTASKRIYTIYVIWAWVPAFDMIFKAHLI